MSERHDELGSPVWGLTKNDKTILRQRQEALKKDFEGT
jgi:hypothetical protein